MSNMKYIHSQKGFTLVEMVVSLGVFSLVMVVAMGAFLKITEVNKRAQNIKNAVNNINFTLEAMSRELRTGSEYELSGTEQITFIGSYHPSGAPIYHSYRRSNNRIQRGTSLTKPVSTFADMTSAGVNIKTMSFTRTDNDYDRVNILIQGEAGSIERLKTSFEVQTTVSQRLTD